MITKNPINFLFKAIPSLEREIKEYFEMWDGRPFSSLSLCGQLMALADLIVDSLTKKKNLKKVKNILIEIERFIVCHGDISKENSLEVCFFETIINPLTHDKKDIKGPFKFFVQNLGPESLKLCKQNDAFWGGKSPYLWNKKNAGK